jgi:hypothetical protein
MQLHALTRKAGSSVLVGMLMRLNVGSADERLWGAILWSFLLRH